MSTATEELELAPVRADEEPSKKQTLVAEILDFERKSCRNTLAMLDRAETLLHRLPESVLGRCSFCPSWLQISSPTREQVMEVLSVLGAGRLTKQISSGDSTRLDYDGYVDGVHVIIYGAQPPPSCRIEVEEVEVPAHKKTVRKLVCT